jgi:hypothetical protein
MKVTIHSSKPKFVNAPGTFTINNPETGFMRVVLYGDWINAGKVSADITITGTAKPESRPAFKREGKLSEGEMRAYTFNIPDGATAAGGKQAPVPCPNSAQQPLQVLTKPHQTERRQFVSSCKCNEWHR